MILKRFGKVGVTGRLTTGSPRREMAAQKTQKTPFQQRLNQIVVDGFLSASIALGQKLNLFRALADVSSPGKPATPQEVADKAGCKERYIREWLNSLACSDIVQVNEQEKFWIDPDHDLCSGTETAFSLMTPVLLKPFSKLQSVFKTDGPCGLDYADFSEFYEVMGTLSRSWHKEHMFSDLVPLLGNDIETNLAQKGLKVLDVGCGDGFHSSLFAEKYPNTHITGIDITPSAIENSNKNRKANGDKFDNLEFIQMDAGRMDAAWTNRFDLVFIFDACHDQMRPDLCIKEIQRVLKPGGVFAMIEIEGSSNVFEDRKTMGGMGSVLYTTSMLHCLPVGYNSKDALGMGAMWGRRRATELIKACGFEDVSVVPTPFFPVNVLYLSKKQ